MNVCVKYFFEHSFSSSFFYLVPGGFDIDLASNTMVDRSTKAELQTPVYDLLAGQEYMTRPPVPPIYLFVIDVSYNAVSSGLYAAATKIIANALDGIPNQLGRTQVGLITLDSAIHFYQIPNSVEEDPKIFVVADLDDPFLPIVDGLLVNLSEARAGFENALGKIPSLFQKTQNTTSALGPALNAASKLMARYGGKIVLIQSAIPNVGQGKLNARDDARSYGTGKENALLQPVNNFYKTLATECVRNHICIDLFLFPKPFIDVATIGCAARFTGGSIFLYETSWDAKNQEAVQKFAGDLSRLVMDDTCLEAVCRIRASQGLTLGGYHGSFFLRSSDLLACPNVNRKHAYTAQITIDENLPGPIAYFQTAVLHTNTRGMRVIRVINAAIPVTDDPREIFAGVDVTALADLLLKMAAEKVFTSKLEDARDALLNKMIDILNAVKTTYSTGNVPQLLLPESMRLLPLLALSILKSPAIRAGTTTPPDLRSYYLALVKTLPVSASIALIYPYMFAIHLMAEEVS